MKLFDKSIYRRDVALRIRYPYCFWDEEQEFFTLKINAKEHRFINLMPIEKEAVLLTFIKIEPNTEELNEMIEAMKEAINEKLGYHYNTDSSGVETVGIIENLPLAKL